MTQQVLEAQNVTPTIVAQPQPAAPVVSLMDRIILASDVADTLEESRKIITDLPHVNKMVFGEIAWEIGKPLPSNPAMTLYVAFKDGFRSMDTEEWDYVAGDVRFYAIPTNGVTDPLASVFARYFLNRMAPTTTVETLTLEGFVREVGTEFYNLAVVKGVIAEPDEEE